MAVTVEPLERAAMAEAAELLARACAFDAAATVADEKLFGPAPVLATEAGRVVDTGVTYTPKAFAVRDGALIGVAAIAGDRIRMLAVAPDARGHGVGTALLAACEAAARADGRARVRTLDQPGNYLAPGVDARDGATLDWLARRGFAPLGEPRTNVLVRVRDNPRVSAARADDAAARARAKGYVVRRAHANEPALLAAVAREFGGAWPFELARALAHAPAPAVHVATRADEYCGFAAHDGNNQGLGWFGPTGTWPAHRGAGLGEALLLACLVDVAADHERCEVAWIGPRPFYDRVAGVDEDRAFLCLAKPL